MRSFVLAAFAAVFFILPSCKRSSSGEDQDLTKVHALDAVPVKFLKKRIETDSTVTDSLVPRTLQQETSCIIDGVFFDDCPLNSGDEVSPGGGGGSDPNSLPDFNPISGSIVVSNPAIMGQPFHFSVVVANAGGNNIPPASLESLPDVSFDGVRVNFHILTPERPQPADNNRVFTGLFDPTTLEDGASYLLSAQFNLISSMVQEGADHQFAVVVDPNNSIAETNEQNNTSFDQETFRIGENAADLLPLTDEGNVTMSPNPVHQGKELTVGCRVKNIGTPVNGNSSIRVKYTASLTKGDKLANPITLGFGTLFLSQNDRLETNAFTRIISKDVTINLAPGEYTIKATVNPNNTITEVSGGIGNNTAVIGKLHVLSAVTTPSLIPNLTVHYKGLVGSRFSPTSVDESTGKVICRVVVENNGTGKVTGPIALRIQSDPRPIIDNGGVTSLTGPKTVLATVHTSGLRPGEFRTVEVEIDVFGFTDPITGNPYDLQAYIQTITWIVDPEKKIKEITDADNSFTNINGFNILTPDLTIPRGVAAFARLIHNGSTSRKTVFTIPIKNAGNLPFKDFTAEFNIYSTTFTFIDKVKVQYGGLSPFSSRTIHPGQVDTVNVIFDGDYTVAGTGFLMIPILDVDSLIMEHFSKHKKLSGGYGDGENNNTGLLKVVPK